MSKKKIFVSLLLVGMCITSQPVMAMQNENCIVSENDTDEIVVFLNESVKENTYCDIKATEQWKDCVSKGYIYMDSDGHLKINESVNEVELQNLTVYSEQLDNWNLALDLHLLEWNEKKQMLYTPQITSEIIDNVTEVLLENEAESAQQLEKTGRGVAHNCNYSKWNVGATCAQNYNTIKNFYNSLLVAQQTNAGVNPWLSTATYWVGYVREGGAWDYKVQKNYQTFCCTYGGVSGQDRSAEWIGNYNYGYTGKFLFDLNTLHMGSYVVSGMDPKDKTTDWPAIDKGYSHAP